MDNLNRTFFRIPVGDFSGDGHSQCDYYTASSALSLKEVREAYFEAKYNIFPEYICPEDIVNLYGEYKLSEEIVESIKEETKFSLDENNFYTKEMAEYVIYFINKGNPNCDARLESTVDDMLNFYGYDEKGRHISNFGYGLFRD